MSLISICIRALRPGHKKFRICFCQWRIRWFLLAWMHSWGHNDSRKSDLIWFVRSHRSFTKATRRKGGRGIVAHQCRNRRRELWCGTVRCCDSWTNHGRWRWPASRQVMGADVPMFRGNTFWTMRFGLETPKREQNALLNKPSTISYYSFVWLCVLRLIFDFMFDIIS